MGQLKIIFTILTLLCAADVWASPQSGEPQSPGVYSHEVVLPTPEPVVDLEMEGEAFNATEATSLSIVQDYLEQQEMITWLGEKISDYALLEYCKDNFSGNLALQCFGLVEGRTFFNSTLNICRDKQKITKANERLKCVQTVASQSFHVLALNVCLKNKNFHLVQCLEEISSQTFDDSMLNICGRLDGSQLVNCLKIIRDKVSSSRDYMICKEVDVDEVNNCLWKFTGGGKTVFGSIYDESFNIRIEGVELRYGLKEDSIRKVDFACEKSVRLNKGNWRPSHYLYWEGGGHSSKYILHSFRSYEGYPTRQSICDYLTEFLSKNFDQLFEQ